MKKTKGIVCLLILVLILCSSTVSMAAATTPATGEEIEVFELEYECELDQKDIILIGFAAEEFTVWVEGTAYTFTEDAILYITERTEEDVFFRWEEDGGLFTIERDKVKYVSEHYTLPAPFIQGSGSASGSTGNTITGSGSSNGGGSFTITYYCSACNSPRGTGTTSSGIQAYVGSVACNNFANGTTIYIEGYGTYTVIDNMGSSNKIDIFRGYFDTCTCSGKGRANAWPV